MDNNKFNDDKNIIYYNNTNINFFVCIYLDYIINCLKNFKDNIIIYIKINFVFIYSQTIITNNSANKINVTYNFVINKK